MLKMMLLLLLLIVTLQILPPNFLVKSKKLDDHLLNAPGCIKLLVKWWDDPTK